MRVQWWYGVAGATLAWIALVLAYAVVPESSPLDRLVVEPVALVAVVAWVAMPVCLYLDRRANGEDMAWTPATRLWILASSVWFVNVLVGAAYCLRRNVATGRTAPSKHWRSVVAASLAAWAGVIAVDAALPPGTIPPAADGGIGALLALSLCAMPIGILLDAVRVRGYTDWDPNSRGYVLGAAIPVVNVLVGAAYLYKRTLAFEGVDASRPFSLPDVDDGRETAGRAHSPWFPRAGYVFGVYFAALVVVAAAVPSLAESGLEVLALVAWLPFGPFFAGCVYKDASWRRATDRPVGDSWWLYLLSAAIQGVAFWYLVRRATRADRWRRRRVAGPEAGSETGTDR